MSAIDTIGEALTHGLMPMDKEWWRTRLRALRASPGRAIHARASITIRRTPRDLYAAFRDFEELPTLLSHLSEVRRLEGERWLWRIKVPGGTQLEWQVRITDDEPDARVAWHSVEDQPMEAGGQVRFKVAPGERGTELMLELTYQPDASLARKTSRILAGLHEVQLLNDLRALKQRMEIGEAVRSDASLVRGPVPAQPAANAASEQRGAS